ncbi:N-formylglutamate amidohydrolase [Labrys okinawensis]|uniref:N-formylglutamate amidohydrolase n=1 Tax=Labrys okinawensis TaxID=346911 RepID=A0A2S9Q4R6_9HYPH|nr:N-formylglutamate amidohydrolase [Labrys okinawensis]
MLESLAERAAGGTSGGEIQPDSAIVDNGRGRGEYVLVCEHASNFVPPRFGKLGLSDADLQRHIAWDPGALGVARVMARELDAPLVSCAVSRLVIDCNRDPSVFDAITLKSEGTVIPGNADLSDAERARRIQEVYEPFHAGVAAAVAAKRHAGPAAIIGIHSFNPVYNGVQRPWHVGILFDRDESLSGPMIAALREDASLVVGVNEPYSPGDRVYHTLDRHGQSQGLPSVMIEIRNDLLATPNQQEEWGMKLATILKRIGLPGDDSPK